MRVRDAGQNVALGEVDVAGVGDPRHDDARDALEDLLAVEGRREELAGLGQQAQPRVRALLAGDLEDHPADARGLTGLVQHRVVAREPVPRVPRPGDRLVGRLLVHDGLAGLEHAPVERLERRREVGDHLRERASDVLLGREPVELRQSVVDLDEAELAVPEADPHRRRDEQRVQLGVGLLRRAEEERVVDRQRGAARDLVRQLEIGLVEAAGRLAGAQRDRAQQPPARLERDDDVRDGFERVVEREVLGVDGGALERVLAGVFDQQRRPRAEHDTDGMSLVRLGRVAAAQLAQEILASGVAVGDHDLAQRAVGLERVDDAVVRNARDEQVREVGERGLEVERRRQQRARLGEEAQASLGVALHRDVVEDVDHEAELAGLAEDGRRADDRPAHVAAEDAVAEDAVLRFAFGEHPPARQLLDRQRRAVLADDLEPLHQLGVAQAQHLLRRGEPAQPRCGVVRVEKGAVRPLGGDSVLDATQDRGKLVHGRGDDLALAQMGREGFEPSTLGLRVPCSTN